MYKKSFFIVFEGIEGSGKSYQAKILYKKLKKRFNKVILTREPGGTKGAEIIRKIILKDYFEKNKKIKFDKYTDTLLYLAARNEHLKNKIVPAIKNKKIIICDRFIDSTFAYQVYGKKVSFNFINDIHKQILGKVKPDLTFILDIDVKQGLSRANSRKGNENRFESKGTDFHNLVRDAYLNLATKNKKRIHVIDASKTITDIYGDIKVIFNKYIKEKI